MILKYIGLGFCLAAPPGPVTLEMIRQGLNHNGWCAFKVRLGAVASCIIVLIMTTQATSTLHSHPNVLMSLSILGSIGLFGVGWKNIKKRKQNFSVEGPPESNPFWSGFLASIANPMSWMFWLSIFVGSSIQHKDSPIPPLFILLGITLWGAGLSALLSITKKAIPSHWISRICLLSGGLLMLYGIYFCIRIIHDAHFLLS